MTKRPANKGDKLAFAMALASLVFIAGWDINHPNEAYYDPPTEPIPRLINGEAMCDTDMECEELRRDLCEAARDDNSESEYCKEDGYAAK